MSKPRPCFRCSRKAYSRSGATWTRRLSRNSEVVKLSAPKRSRRLARVSSWVMLLLPARGDRALEPGSRGEVAGGHHRLRRRQPGSQRPRALGGGAALELLAVE